MCSYTFVWNRVRVPESVTFPLDIEETCPTPTHSLVSMEYIPCQHGIQEAIN